MPQTFHQNGHTFGSMWTLRSSWPFEKLRFLVVNTLKEKIKDVKKSPKKKEMREVNKNKIKYVES